MKEILQRLVYRSPSGAGQIAAVGGTDNDSRNVVFVREAENDLELQAGRVSESA